MRGWVKKKKNTFGNRTAQKEKGQIRINPFTYSDRHTEDLEKFIDSYSELVEANNWDEKNGLHYLTNYQKGSARDTLSNFRRRIPGGTSEDFFDFLRLHLKTEKFYNLRTQLDMVFTETTSPLNVIQYITDVSYWTKLFSERYARSTAQKWLNHTQTISTRTPYKNK